MNTSESAIIAVEGPVTDVRSPQAEELELSIVMPCLNEAGTVATCIEKAKGYMAERGISGEVIVADNGSTDGSPEIAAAHGARVVLAEQRGYGAALQTGIEASRGRYIIMGDSDGSYDFGKLDGFVDKLREGCDIVVGNRYGGGIEKRAMPWLHHYLGNPLLSAVGRLFTGNRLGDFYCGLRGFSRAAYDRLTLQSTGMEFALEMLVKGTMFGMNIAEVPTTLSLSGPGRCPHLRTWNDGWRSIKFYLLFCPRWLYLTPGIAAICLGLAGAFWLCLGSSAAPEDAWRVQWLIGCGAILVLGIQAACFWVFVKISFISAGLHPRGPWAKRLTRLAVPEQWLATGVGMTFSGLVGAGWELLTASAQEPGVGCLWLALRSSFLWGMLFIVGMQMVMGGFYLGAIKMVDEAQAKRWPR